MRGVFDVLAGRGKLDEESLLDLEEALYESDFGVETTEEIIQGIRESHRKDKEMLGRDAVFLAKATLERVLSGSELSFAPSSSSESKPEVVCLVGVNGSGKTTTLYACLSKLYDPRKKIITIEDPVEYELGGINQIPVNPKRGLTFATGLRSILRQDPDVIFVGETRDAETIDIVIRSALTGHLVFSTLHTNDALSSVGRMIDMGAQMDSKLLKAGAEAHASAISSLPASGVCSEAQLTAINAAIGRMIASVPESYTMGVYDTVGSLMDPKVPAYLMSTVKENDARNAYNALVDFAGVVKAQWPRFGSVRSCPGWTWSWFARFGSRWIRFAPVRLFRLDARRLRFRFGRCRFASSAGSG